MRAFEAAIVATLIALIVAGPTAAQADPAPVIAAERAFAARAAEAGIARSFLDFMTDDAIVFAPKPVSARQLYGERPGRTPAQGGPLLAWWPNWAGIARSGDLGFTTGPAELNGKRSVNYFTVWKKQADGGWKWVYDGGASDASQGRPVEAPVEVLPPGDPRPMSSETAMTQVRASEAALARAAAADVPDAYKAVLAQDARMQGSPLPPATTPAAIATELGQRAPAIRFTPLGGEASQAGDLAWTYGEAAWAKAGVAGHGHYVRIWQRRSAGWRLVFDQLLDDAPAP